MEQFIEVHTEEGKRLINLRWVEEIRKNPDGHATIYFTSNCPGASQDYLESAYFMEVAESYSEILNKIWR